MGAGLIGHRDFRVLAEGAAQIAAKAACGKNLTAWIKTAQGLFFDRVQDQGCQLAVIQADDLAALISTGLAEADLSFREDTAVKTKRANSGHVCLTT